MKKYLLAGGLASVLLLGACGTETETNEDVDESETTEEVEANDNDSTEEGETVEGESNSEADADESESSEDVEESETDASSDEGTRTNPMSLGEVATLDVFTYGDDGDRLEGTAEIEISNIYRGDEALGLMQDEYMGYDQFEEDGYEYAVVDVRMKLIDFVDENTSYTLMEELQAVGEDGTPAPRTFTTIPDSFDSSSVYTGGEIEGKVALPVPVEGDFLIKHDDGFDTVFFEVE